MIDVVPIDSFYLIFILYSGSIFSIIAVLIILLLLCHLIHIYFKLFYQQNSEQNRTVYKLGIVYLLIALIQCGAYGFGRSNVFTLKAPYSFTVLQCQFGYALFYYALVACIIILEVILLHRIKTIFVGSTFAYKPCTFYCLYALMTLTAIVFITYYSVFMVSQDWSVYYDEKTGIAYCQNNFIRMKKLSAAIGGFLHLCVSVGLLFMFCKGLWSLNKAMILQFHAEYIGKHSPASMSASIDIVMDEYKTNVTTQRNEQIGDKTKRIVELHNLIKKQSILVCIAISSSLLYLLWLAMTTFAAQQFGWDLTVNSICLCLMYKTSEKYWICCKKYGCCQCCYIKANQVGL